jgi:hypothetical protein
LAVPLFNKYSLSTYYVTTILSSKRGPVDQAWWFTPVIPATPEEEIKRTKVPGQPKKKHET